MGITANREEKKGLLSHEETLRLIELVQNGDNEAKEILIESNLGLVRSIVTKFLNIGYERDDLFGKKEIVKVYSLKFIVYSLKARDIWNKVF